VASRSSTTPGAIFATGILLDPKRFPTPTSGDWAAPTVVRVKPGAVPERALGPIAGGGLVALGEERVVAAVPDDLVGR
jgi:hypothetical protein